jgi:hypothetical protein
MVDQDGLVKYAQVVSKTAFFLPGGSQAFIGSQEPNTWHLRPGDHRMTDEYPKIQPSERRAVAA